jgi:hypothetical protein
MKMIHKLLLFFAGVVHFTGWSNDSELRLTGNIGKAIVYLEATEEGTEFYGRYFYKAQLIDIPLKGTFKAGVYSFVTNYDDFYGTPEEMEYLVFKKSEDKFIGTWSKDGKKLSVSFVAIQPSEMNSKRLSNNPKLNDLKLSGLDLVKLDQFKLSGNDTVKEVQGFRWRSFTEKHTNLELVRLDSGLSDGKKKIVNQYLELIHVQRFLELLDCSAVGGELTNFDYSYTVEIIHESVLSLSFFNYYMCVGMRHPEEANFAVNIDLETESELKNTDFLNVHALEEDHDGTSIFQAVVYNYFKKTQPDLFDDITADESDSSDDGCEYDRIDLWTAEMGMCFTTEGLRLLPYFPHMMAPCLEPGWAIVPYSELKDLLKESFYTRIVGIKH